MDKIVKIDDDTWKFLTAEKLRNGDKSESETVARIVKGYRDYILPRTGQLDPEAVLFFMPDAYDDRNPKEEK